MVIGRISLCDTSFESCLKLLQIAFEKSLQMFRFWGRYGLKTENNVEFGFQRFLNDQC